jgi:thiamine-phosphate pyrophosphorylase
MAITAGHEARWPVRDLGAWRACLEGVAECGALLQLREKLLSDLELYSLSVWVRDRFTGALSINGRLDIAAACSADGVHLPARGLDSRAAVVLARNLSSSRGSGPLLLGRSCHRLDEVHLAAQAGLDYVTFGPVAPTSSKPGAALTGFELLGQACSHGIPVLALGGLSLHNASTALQQGAWGIAGISAFQDPSQRIGLSRMVADHALVEHFPAERLPEIS